MQEAKKVILTKVMSVEIQKYFCSKKKQLNYIPTECTEWTVTLCNDRGAYS